MKARLFYSFVILSLILGSCAQSEEAGSELQGQVAWGIYNALVAENTEEGMARALAERLATLKELSSSGQLADGDSCPVSDDSPCGIVHLVVEFSPAGTAQVGHTGIGLTVAAGGNLRHSYYDFGPGTNTTPDGKSWRVGDPGVFSLPRAAITSPLVRQPGTQWWDNQHSHDGAHPSNIGMPEILETLDTVAGDYDIVRVPVCIAKGMQQLIQKYWIETYLDMPAYSVPGNQCTSMVVDSYEDAYKIVSQTESGKLATTINQYKPDFSFLGRAFESPDAFGKRLLTDTRYQHQCGALKGKQARAVILNHTKQYEQNPTLRSFIDWQINRSL